MTCPAITIADASLPFRFESCQLFYLSNKKPKQVANIIGTSQKEYATSEERFDAISEWALSSIRSVIGEGSALMFIEDYSLGSRGRVFHIAENTGLVKHKLWKAGYPITAIPPTVIKKFGSGKGNSTKDQMYAAFRKETNVDLMSIFQPKAAAVGSPVGDLVDSFYVAKYGYTSSILNTR